MFLEPKRVKTEISYAMSVESLRAYLKWMEYIPEHWNITKILKKNTSELTSKEIEILKLLNEENQYKKIFKECIVEDKEVVSIPTEIDYYLSKMPIQKYALIKLTSDQIENCMKKVSKFNTLDEIELGLSVLKEKDDRDILDEYVLFKLTEKRFRLSLSLLNLEIQEKAKENNDKYISGYDSIKNKIFR